MPKTARTFPLNFIPLPFSFFTMKGMESMKGSRQARR